MKTKVAALFVLLVLVLAGCGKAEPEQLRVYSFSGENEQFSISNGVIVLSSEETVFYGGILTPKELFPAEVTSCSATFYWGSGGEEQLLLSHSVVDQTGACVNVAGDLGKISGPDAVWKTEFDSLAELLYFKLVATDKSGEEFVYQLPLSVTEITSQGASSAA